MIQSDEVMRLEQSIKRVKEARDKAYRERNKLVAALSKLLPSHLLKHDENDEGWDKDLMNIVCILGGAGPMTWHIQDKEIWMYEHLPKGHLSSCESWDGHNTEEKYARLAELSNLSDRMKSAVVESSQ
jgi:hypothetical protein